VVSKCVDLGKDQEAYGLETVKIWTGQGTTIVRHCEDMDNGGEDDHANRHVQREMQASTTI
jgi:hypothetical protein